MRQTTFSLGSQFLFILGLVAAVSFDNAWVKGIGIGVASIAVYVYIDWRTGR